MKNSARQEVFPHDSDDGNASRPRPLTWALLNWHAICIIESIQLEAKEWHTMMFNPNGLWGNGLSLKVLCGQTLLLLAIVPLARGQDTAVESESRGGGKSANPARSSGLEPDAQAGFLSNGVELPSVFPMILQRNLISRFSMGEIYDSGLRNGPYANESDTFTEASASFAYQLRRKRTEYAVDYRYSARFYNRFSNLNVIAHDLGLSQIRQLTRHLAWNLNYRYNLTPDYSGGLLQESLAREFSFANPLPTAGMLNPVPSLNPGMSSGGAIFANPLPGGVSLLPTTVNTLPQMLSPGDGLLALRSIRMTNHAATNLNYDLNARTAFFSQAGFQRMRYEDRNLFGADSYSISAGMRHLFSPRTSAGIAYQAGRTELPFLRHRYTSQGFVVSLNRQLTQSTYLTLTVGPAWADLQSQETIPLSPLLANLLGRPALSRDVARALPSWMGSMGVATQWHRLNLNLNYGRSVGSTNGLGGASFQQHYSASLGRPLGRKTSFSVTAVYSQSEFLAIRDPIRLNQRALGGTFTRRLSSSLDLVAFVNYSKILTGLQSSFLLNHNQFGIRFQYHFPRLRQM